MDKLSASALSAAIAADSVTDAVFCQLADTADRGIVSWSAYCRHAATSESRVSRLCLSIGAAPESQRASLYAGAKRSLEASNGGWSIRKHGEVFSPRPYSAREAAAAAELRSAAADATRTMKERQQTTLVGSADKWAECCKRLGIDATSSVEQALAARPAADLPVFTTASAPAMAA